MLLIPATAPLVRQIKMITVNPNIGVYLFINNYT